jgi:hypothetical protein
MVFIVNSAGVPSVASFIQMGGQPAPTVPAAPSAVTATPGNGSAAVSWSAPSDGGSAITSYAVTPYIGTTAQPSTTVTGAPPATSATINGLTNGTAYTFTVTAANSVGTGPPSSPSNVVTPSATTVPVFIQQASTHTGGVTSASLQMPAKLSAGDRLIVETGVWSGGGATMKSVTDSAGNTYTELLHYKAADGTEMSVWSSPVTAGAGAALTVTATATGAADIGASVLEYAGLSNAVDATAVDQMAHSFGKTASAASVSSGATAATTAGNELALGFYADSGFGDTLTAGTGFTPRVNVSNTGDMELLGEDQVVGAGATPNASVGTGANTYWLMATIVFKPAAAPLASLDRPLAGHSAAASSSRRRGSPKRSRTLCAHHSSRGVGRACRSLRRATAITRRAKWRFVYDALLMHLSASLFCPHRGTQTLARLVGLSGGWFAYGSSPVFKASVRRL